MQAPVDHLNPDARFPTDNAFDIPVLDLSLQADWLDLPVTAWGSQRRRQGMVGTWHFYVDDYRFETLWERPYLIPETGCRCVIEPNYTTSEQMSRARVLWRTYQKRWLARLWQTQGLKIVVDLNVAVNRYEDNFLGVPVGWRAYSTRGYSERLDDLLYEYQLACNHAETADILFCVMGGGKAVRELCDRHQWMHIIERADIVREQKREQSWTG